MTQSTNPLDRIRALAPADMTDDELGVAVLLTHPDVRFSVNCDGWVNLNHPHLPTHVVVTPSCLAEFPVSYPNPALSYDALLPIVRDWAGQSPERMIALTLGLDRGVMANLLEAVQDMRRDCADWRFDETLATSWVLLQLSPRQLAEAFVTAARSVQ